MRGSGQGGYKPVFKSHSSRTATPSMTARGTSAQPNHGKTSPGSEFRPRLTYAIAPPNQATPAERRRSIAAAQSARICSLPVDALLVYDVQDEATRNGEPRPFAFAPKVDPLSYAYDELQIGTLPRVVYRAVAGDSELSLCRWLDILRRHGGAAVLVGAPSRCAPATLTLPSALLLGKKHGPETPMGGVVIPERHEMSGAEDARVWAKVEYGCRFFVSQTVWSVSVTKRLLVDLRNRADREGACMPPLLLTFSPCGSQQTLEFMSWLGVTVPDWVKRDLLTAKDMLARSIQLAADGFAEVRAFASEHGLSVGCNVESVSSRAAEIEASVELVHRVARLDARPEVAAARSLGALYS